MKIDLFSVGSLTLPVAATATASASTALPGQGNTIRIVNEGPNVAFIAVGTGAQTAVLTNTCVYLGETTLSIPAGALNISAVCRATQTAQLNVQVGEGT